METVGRQRGAARVPLALGLGLSMLNHRMEAQALESWLLLLEMMTKGRVEVCGDSRRSGRAVPGPPALPPAPCPHLQLHLQPAVRVRQREGDEMQLLRHGQGTLRSRGTVSHRPPCAPAAP